MILRELLGARELPDAPAASCLIIGEVAQAHDGSLGMAHAFVDAIAAAGADAVKFQTHLAAAESTPAEPWRVPFSKQDASRYDYWRRMEFTEDQWRGLKEHAEKRGLVFLSSPFSPEAVALLRRIGVRAWKVASGEITSPDVFEPIADTGQPILMSTGMSDMAEIDDAVARMRARNIPFAVMQCTSSYPCPPERVGLNMLSVFRQRYDCPVGLSDHSGVIFPGLAAATLGADVLEVHITLSREMFGPDVAASITTAELNQLVRGVRFIEAAMANAVDKDDVARGLRDVRRLFTKSVVARTDLQAGTILEAAHLAARKPGTGVPAARLGEFVGTRLRRALRENDMLAAGDVEIVS